MRIEDISGQAAPPGVSRLRLPVAAVLLAAAILSGCAGLQTAARRQVVPPPPRDLMTLEQATTHLVEATLARADLAPGRYKLVIDPLIDRASGAETTATRSMETQMADLIRARHPQFELLPFSVASLEERPLVLLGAITTVTAAGSLTNAAPAGHPPAYRIWAVLADLSSGTVVSHETAWVRPDSVDPAPAPFFRDSPAWTTDAAATAYLRTCALNPGDAIDPTYLRSIRSQALVTDGVRAYEARRYTDALALYREALRVTPPDQQLRARNGLYLTNWALGRRQDAEAAFGDLIDYGLRRDRLAVKFVFRPGSTSFWPDATLTRPYPMWIRQIATRTSEQSVCLRVEGHTSITGTVTGNDRLSQARAEAIRLLLIRRRLELRSRLVSVGMGSREALIGTGTDDASDLLDRRVEFEPLRCPEMQAAVGVDPQRH